LLEKIKNLITAINELKNKANSQFQMISGTANEIKDDLPGQLVQYLLAEYFLQNQPKVGSLLRLFGIIEIKLHPATASRPAYYRREIHFERIRQLFTDPLKTLRDLCGWASAALDKMAIYGKICSVLESWNAPARTVLVPQTVAS